MMKLTPTLKTWLIENTDATDELSDDDFRKQAGLAMADGRLSTEKFLELSQDEEDRKADDLFGKLDAIIAGQTKLADGQTKLAERVDKLENGEDPPERKSYKDVKPSEKAPRAEGDGEDPQHSVFDKMFAGAEEAIEVRPGMPHIRHRTAHEQYDGTRKSLQYPTHLKSGARHPRAGEMVMEGERFMHAPSQRDLAVSGAYVKWMIHCETGGRGVPSKLKMTEHDRELIQYALAEEKWSGVYGAQGSAHPGTDTSGAIGVMNRTLNSGEIKAITDESTSGGLELAPIVFDDAVIQTPQLFGEFFPRVNVVPITRGRRVEGASIGNVTLSSQAQEQTQSIPLFNTASFISAFDTTIFVCNGAIEMGMDFLSDSPVDVAGIITRQYGETLLAWLDEQICVGDGTTEPEGIMNASGTTSVSSANGAGGPPTVGDYEGLLLGVNKEYTQGFQRDRIAFGANQTTYRRARAINVGSTDARRVFGMSYEDWMLMGHPYGINSNFTNAQACFGNFARYRMYRRLGLAIKVTTEGKTLVRDNLLLITARARFGGQVETGSAFSVVTDMQS